MKLSLNQANKEQRDLDDAWSDMIKSNDGWCCQICGEDYRVAAHHITPRELKTYRYCPDNGITLCTSHHKFSRVISAHNSPLHFFMWLQRFKPDLFAAATERAKLILKQNGIQFT